ncbi:MAG: hypothetical protein EOP05_15130, partial [Proteobacteria bacterium]
MSASPAIATTTIDSVDESRVSAVAGVNSSTDNPVDDDTTTAALPKIYGGIAGALTVGDCAVNQSGVSTCSNCAVTTDSTPDNNLLACNERRIHPALQVRLLIKSDSVDSGVPMITYVPTTGSDTTSQPLYNPTNITVTKNTTAEVNVLWSEICSRMTTTGGASASGCALTNGTGSDQATITLRVGVDAFANGVRSGTLDDGEYVNVQFILRNGIRITNTTVGNSILDKDDVAVQYFEIGSGDKKAYIKDNLRALAGFPVGNNISFRWVRALYEKRDEATKNTTPVWSKISSGSPHVDLEITGDATTSIDLSPRRIENLDNDAVYDFKLAMVDAARNVGYYTSAVDDIYCEGGSASDGGSGAECHTARPSEVVGVLEKSVNCFVATAAYGSPMAAEVTTFRRFRDHFLLPHKFGRQFIWFYYKNGPIAAKFIAESDTLRAVSRAALWAPLKFAKFSLTYGIAAAFALLSTLILAPPAVWFGA